MTPTPTAFDILELGECTKAKRCRDEPSTECVARLLVGAWPVPGSRLDSFPSLPAGNPCGERPIRERTSPVRHAQHRGAWWSPGVEPSGRRALR